MKIRAGMVKHFSIKVDIKTIGMNNKDDMSRLKAWLILLVSLLDDAALVALIFLALWFFHVKITWEIILVIALVVAGFFFLMHHAIVPGMRRRKITGAEGMVGEEGAVTQALKPRGVVKIRDEYWKAKSIEGEIPAGENIEVVGIKGLVLEVKRKR